MIVEENGSAKAGKSKCDCWRGPEGPLFHGDAGLPRLFTRHFLWADEDVRGVKAKIKYKIKGVGQECPTHMSKTKVRLTSRTFGHRGKNELLGFVAWGCGELLGFGHGAGCATD